MSEVVETIRYLRVEYYVPGGKDSEDIILQFEEKKFIEGVISFPLENGHFLNFQQAGFIFESDASKKDVIGNMSDNLTSLVNTVSFHADILDNIPDARATMVRVIPIREIKPNRPERL